MRARYMLLKDSPELKKGAIMEEMCDDHTQQFKVISKEWDQKESMQYECSYDRKVVTEQPDWFQKVSLLWLTKEQMAKVKKILKI